MRLISSHRAVIAIAIVLLGGCSAPPRQCQHTSCGEAVDLMRANLSLPSGISGMGRTVSGQYLVVHDSYTAGEPRLGLLTVNPETELAKARFEYQQLLFPDSASANSNDLEGVCRLPDAPDEFLLSESGYWKGDFGRIFHVRLEKQVVVLKHEVQLPMLRNNSPESRGDQFEGIACAKQRAGKTLVILGERGGSAAYPNGVLRWGSYDAVSGVVDWSDQSLEVPAPDPLASSTIRSISGLSIDEQNRLWASASVDRGDMGPFRSFVYLLGHVQSDETVPVTLAMEPPQWVVDGFKVEAVSAERSRVTIGTEDEDFGGSWRPLMPPPKAQ